MRFALQVWPWLTIRTHATGLRELFILSGTLKMLLQLSGMWLGGEVGAEES